MKTSLFLLPHIAKVYKLLTSLPCSVIIFADGFRVDQEALAYQTTQLVNFLKCEYLTPQQISNAKSEVQRLHCLSQLCTLQGIVARKKRQLEGIDQQQLFDHAKLLVTCGQGVVPSLTDEQSQAIHEILRGIQNKYSIGEAYKGGAGNSSESYA